MRLCVAGAAPLYSGGDGWGVRRCLLAPKRAGTARRGGAVPRSRLTAGPASAASRQHPGNRRRSHEPGFPAQFISQPFWSPPCSLRTANPGCTRCPGCAGRGDQRSDLGTPGHCLSARPLFFFLGSAPEEDILFASAASFFFFFLYFLPVFPCCL